MGHAGPGWPRFGASRRRCKRTARSGSVLKNGSGIPWRSIPLRRRSTNQEFRAVDLGTGGTRKAEPLMLPTRGRDRKRLSIHALGLPQGPEEPLVLGLWPARSVTANSSSPGRSVTVMLPRSARIRRLPFSTYSAVVTLGRRTTSMHKAKSCRRCRRQIGVRVSYAADRVRVSWAVQVAQGHRLRGIADLHLRAAETSSTASAACDGLGSTNSLERHLANLPPNH